MSVLFNKTTLSNKFMRLAQFPLFRMVVAFAAITLLAFPILVVAHVADLHGSLFIAAHLLSALVALCVYLACVHLMEHRRAVELALVDLLPQFGKGFVIGAGLQMAVFGVLAICGAYSVTGVNTGLDTGKLLILMFLNALGAGLLEEVWLRGAVFRNMEQSLGTWLTLLLSTLIFGSLHGFNSGITWQEIAGIVIGPGVLLAAAYVYARQLWICIGLHSAWNFADGAVFGLEKPNSVFSATVHGPYWLTGGPTIGNSSIVVILVCLVASIVFLLLARRRGRIIAPSWKRNRIPE